MNKTELISTLAEKLEVSKAESGRILENVMNTIIEGVKEGECVLPGIGKLKLVDVAASSGVAMGKAWSKPAHKKVKLSLSVDGKKIGN